MAVLHVRFGFFIISIGYYEPGRFTKSRVKFNQALILILIYALQRFLSHHE